MQDVRRKRYEDVADWPMTGIALAFLVAYAIPVLDPGVSPPVAAVCRLVGVVAWAAFAVDYAVRVWLSERRWHFVRTHPLELAAVLLPVLRPLRLLRLLTIVTVLRRDASRSLRGRVIVYAAGSIALVMLLASLAVLDAERRATDSSIRTFGDATWWAITTVTTAGYGDLYPVTGTGRVVAALLMLTGIALLGVVTASLASWLVQDVTDAEAQREAEAGAREQAAVHADLARLTAEVAALKALLEGRREPVDR